MSGWRGPATVVKVDPNGDIHVKYQSLIHTCRQQDVRPAMLYWGNVIATAYLVRGEDTSFNRLRSFVEAMSNKQHLHLGYYKDNGQWKLTSPARQNYQLFLEALRVADQDAQIHNCVGIRLARATPQLAALQYYSDSVIWHWNDKNDYDHEG